jgi:hypothetical protein
MLGEPAEETLHSEEFEELLGRYLAGVACDPERELIEEHLAKCRHCREVVRLGQAIEAEWKGLASSSPSDALWAVVVSRIRSKPEPLGRRFAETARTWVANWWERVWPVGVGLAAAAAAFVIILKASDWWKGGGTRWVGRGESRASRISVERTQQARPPRYDLSELLGAAHAVLTQAAASADAGLEPNLPLKSRFVAAELGGEWSGTASHAPLSPLLTDVELALLELSAAAGDPDPKERLGSVRRFVEEEDLLVRVAVARARLQAFAQRDELPHEIVEAYLREPD